MNKTENQRQTCKIKRKIRRSKKQKNKQDYFDTVTDKFILEILKYVPRRELGPLALLSRRFSRLTEDRSLWKNVVIESGSDNEDDVFSQVGTLMRLQVQHLTLRYVTIPSPLRLPTLEATQSSWCLEELCLSMIQICPDDLAQLFNHCKRLKKVILEDIGVNNKVLEALSGNKNLKILHLLELQDLEQLSFVTLLQNVTSLEEFRIGGHFLLTRSTTSITLNTITKNLPPSLLRLTLSYWIEIKDQNIEDIVRNCPLLQKLEVSPFFSPAITSRSTEALRNFKHLRILNIRGCPRIPREAYLPLAAMERLEKLDIYHAQRDEEGRRFIEELFKINVVESQKVYNRLVERVGSFQSQFGVVRLTY